MKHLNQQQKCPEAGSGCPFVTGYENNMRAHLKLVHKWEEITCMIPDCTFKTVVDQKMQDHLTKVHNARYDEATHALVCFAWALRINASSACNRFYYLHRFYPDIWWYIFTGKPELLHHKRFYMFLNSWDGLYAWYVQVYSIYFKARSLKYIAPSKVIIFIFF